MQFHITYSTFVNTVQNLISGYTESPQIPNCYKKLGKRILYMICLAEYLRAGHCFPFRTAKCFHDPCGYSSHFYSSFLCSYF